MAHPTASLEMISVVSVFSDALGDHMFVNDVSEQQVFSWRKTLFFEIKGIERQYPHDMGSHCIYINIDIKKIII